MRVALVLLSAIIALCGCTRETPGAAVSPPGLTAQPEPEPDDDQIVDLVDRFAQAWNAREFGDLRGLMCTAMRSQSEFGEDALRDVRADSGRLDLQITELDVTGDNAQAIIENNGDDPDDITFVREGGEWKWCEF